MKQYIKDGIIKYRNQIVLHGTRTITDKDGNERVVKTQIIGPKEEQLLDNGWVEYTTPTVDEGQLSKQREIHSLKRTLSTTDYKVIKCMEAYLCGEELPYNIEELHEERNTQRAEINTLENEN